MPILPGQTTMQSYPPVAAREHFPRLNYRLHSMLTLERLPKRLQLICRELSTQVVVDLN